MGIGVGQATESGRRIEGVLFGGDAATQPTEDPRAGEPPMRAAGHNDPVGEGRHDGRRAKAAARAADDGCGRQAGEGQLRQRHADAARCGQRDRPLLDAHPPGVECDDQRRRSPTPHAPTGGALGQTRENAGFVDPHCAAARVPIHEREQDGCPGQQACPGHQRRAGDGGLQHREAAGVTQRDGAGAGVQRGKREGAWRRGQVPSPHDVRYSRCSGVSRSISNAQAVELEGGDGVLDLLRHVVDPIGSLPLRLARTAHSALSACVAKLMSMTDAGCPSAAARLTRRPSPMT